MRLVPITLEYMQQCVNYGHPCKTVSEICDDLTFDPEQLNPQSKNFKSDKKPVRCYLNNRAGTCLYVPKYYAYKHFRHIFDNHQFNWGTPCNIALDPAFAPLAKFKQPEAVARVLEDLRARGTALLSLPCGFGKTFSAIYIASMLRHKDGTEANKNVKTLIVVPSIILMKQWQNEIHTFSRKDAHGNPVIRVGRLQGKTGVDVANKDIVIASLSSVCSAERYTDDIVSQFGCIVFDECHKLAATTYAQTINLYTCQYMIGLSATVDRRDKMEPVFQAHLGEISYIYKRHDDPVTVRVVHYTNPAHKCYGDVPYNHDRKDSLVAVNALCDNDDYNLLLAYKTYCLYREGRDIIATSKLLKQMEKVKYFLCTTFRVPEHDIGILNGSVKNKDREALQTRRILIISFQIGEVGLNIASKNSLLLYSPFSKSPEQVCGRILRKIDPLQHPVVYDFIAKANYVFVNMFNNRRKQYLKANYKLVAENLSHTQFRDIMEGIDSMDVNE